MYKGDGGQVKRRSLLRKRSFLFKNMVENIFDKELEKRRIVKFPDDSIVKEKLKAVKRTIKEVKKSHIEIIGCSIFGSMTRNEVRKRNRYEEGSDIDLYVFVDPNLGKYSKIYKEPFYFSFPSKIENHYAKIIQDRFKEEDKSGDSKNYPISPHIIPISRSIMNEMVIDFDKHDSAMGSGNEVAPSNLLQIFDFQLEGDLKTYREYLFNTLERVGPKGEKIWSRIIKQLRRSNKKEKFEYPSNLERARKYKWE